MINVMVNGFPGKMASVLVRKVLQQEDMRLVPDSLTGPEHQEVEMNLDGDHRVWLRPVDKCNPYEFLSLMKDHHEDHPGSLVIVDFSHPSAVQKNVELYCLESVPFVLGTTFDKSIRGKLEETVEKHSVPAIIAPNMALQIVALQRTVQRFAAENRGRMEGYILEITESHQQGKEDTSGTARAMVDYFNTLGIDFKVEQIVKIRDPEKQLAMGVPKEHLDGHAWHKYTLTMPAIAGIGLGSLHARLTDLLNHPAFKSLDQSRGERYTASTKDGNFLYAVECRQNGLTENTKLIINHNVNGRDIYADPGALDAIRFVSREAAKGMPGKVFSMSDVLDSMVLGGKS